MSFNKILFLLPFLFLSACKDAHIQEHGAWAARFKEHGITNGCFILRDHTHETVHLYNRARCLQRFMPASTFKIFNSLVALELGVVKDDGTVIKWDGIHRRPEWDKDMDMREAFKVSNVPYYQELARRIERQNYQHFLDTVQYGNRTIGPRIDTFWLDNSLQISPDEQVGFIKKLYFEELPFNVRAQTIVRSMMLRETIGNSKLYYKTGSGRTPQGAQLLWVVGFQERTEYIKEQKESMNKSDVRNYPYFFALNFEVPAGDQSKDWAQVRIQLLHELLTDYGTFKAP